MADTSARVRAWTDSEKMNATDKLNVYEVFPPGIHFLQQRVGRLPGFSSSFLPIHSKDSSIIRDPFPPSSRASTDEP